MNRNTWRQLASGLLAATLSLGIAACDDDTSSGTGDMAVGADMSATAGDMTMGTPGNGQITLADVVGTVYSPTVVAPRTHTLVAVASLPKFAGTPDPSSNFGVTPTIHGCSVYRYNATNLPGADGDAGDVTLSGFNTAFTIGVNAKNGSKSASPMSGSSPIKCKRSATTMLYSCAYSGAGGPDAGEAGAPVSDIIYPVIPYNVVLNANRAMVLQNIPPSSGGWPYGAATCVPRYAFNPMDPNPMCTQTTFVTTPADCTTAIEVCEQTPIVPLGVSTITETIAGGTDWPAYSDTMLGNGGGLDGGAGQLAGPLYVLTVTSGTTDITGVDPLTFGPSLSMANAAIDATKDLTITFSCDPNNPTAGAGCGGSQDLVGLLLTTSTSKKTAFSVSTATGTASCSQPVAAPGGTIVVKSNQLTALLGGQTGGSWQIALVRLTTHLKSPLGTHPLMATTAGMGVFGFTNQ